MILTSPWGWMKARHIHTRSTSSTFSWCTICGCSLFSAKGIKGKCGQVGVGLEKTYIYIRERSLIIVIWESCLAIHKHSTLALMRWKSTPDLNLWHFYIYSINHSSPYGKFCERTWVSMNVPSFRPSPIDAYLTRFSGAWLLLKVSLSVKNGHFYF